MTSPVPDDPLLGRGRGFSGRLVYANTLMRNALFLAVHLEHATSEERNYLKHLIHHAVFGGQGSLNNISFYPPKYRITWREVLTSVLLVFLAAFLVLTVVLGDRVGCLQETPARRGEDETLKQIFDLRRHIPSQNPSQPRQH